MVTLFRFCHTLNRGIITQSLQVFVSKTSLNERILHIFLLNSLIRGYSTVDGKILVLLRYTNGNPAFKYIRPLIHSQKPHHTGKRLSTSLEILSSSTGISLSTSWNDSSIGVPFLKIIY